MYFMYVVTVFLVIGAALACGGAPSGAPVSSTTSKEKMQVAEDPDLSEEGVSLTNVLDGTPILFNDYEGQVILVNFWATWCPPCRHEIPDLIRLQQNYGSQGFQIIGVSVDEGPPSNVAEFVKENQINYPVGLITESALKRFGSPRAVPTTFVINRDGEVKERIVGARSYEGFAQIIEPYL